MVKMKMKMSEPTGSPSPRAAVAETATNRKQPLLLENVMSFKEEKKMMCSRDIRPRNRIGEVAGGTAAECAAVCCCCPCTLVHLIVLAVYKVPTGLIKKAIKKRKKKKLFGKKLKNKISLSSAAGAASSEKKNQWTQKFEIVTSEEEGDEDTQELDSEMWDRFNGTGFWRSCSRREE